MNEPERQSLKSGGSDPPRFIRLEDGRWVCLFGFDGGRARLLPSEEMGVQILRDSKRSTTVAIVVLFLATLLMQLTVGYEAASGFWIFMVGAVAFYGTSLLGALWLRRRYHALPITDRTAAMEGKFDSRSALITWSTFVAMLVSSFGAGYFFALNDAVPWYIQLAVFGSVAVCGLNVHRFLTTLRYRA